MDDSPARAAMVAETLAAILTAERLRPIDIMRASGIARNTIVLILRGETGTPLPATLAGLARGCATEPKPPHEVNTTKERRYFRALAISAGYVTVQISEARTLLELGLIARTGSVERARAWLELFERHHDASARMIREGTIWADDEQAP